jgi:hypothetical protein
MENNGRANLHNRIRDFLMNLMIRARIAVNNDTIPAISWLGKRRIQNSQAEKYR